MSSIPRRPLPRHWPSRPAASIGLGLALLLVGGCSALSPAPPQLVLVRQMAAPADDPAALAMAVASEVTALRDGLRSPWSSPVLLPVGARTPSELVLANPHIRRPIGRADIGQGARASAGRSLAGDGRAGAAAGAAQAGAALAPVLSIGGRLRVTGEPLSVADAYRARGLGAGPVGPGRGTRFGVEWRPAKATLGLEHGAIGMQLESGYRLSLKVRHGRPSLYLRGRF